MKSLSDSTAHKDVKPVPLDPEERKLNEKYISTQYFKYYIRLKDFMEYIKETLSNPNTKLPNNVAIQESIKTILHCLNDEIPKFDYLVQDMLMDLSLNFKKSAQMAEKY